MSGWIEASVSSEQEETERIATREPIDGSGDGKNHRREHGVIQKSRGEEREAGASLDGHHLPSQLAPHARNLVAVASA